MFIRLLASLFLLNILAIAQTPGTPNTQPSPQAAPTAFVQAATNQPTSSDTIEKSFDVATIEKIGHGVSAPIPLSTPQAKYTREAKKKRIQGVCLVSIIVDANGVPQNPKVVRSVGYGLDESALEAIKKYRFKPSMKDGHPVAVQMSVEVNFRLY